MTKHYLFYEREGDRLAIAGHVSEALEAYERALELRPSARWIASKQKRLRDTFTRERGDAGTARAFSLFLPYYTPQDEGRAAEIRECVRNNLDCGLFAQIILLVDDDSAPPQEDRRLQVIRLDRRPRYLDWVHAARRICPDQIAILANSDIHFDSSLGQLHAIFTKDRNAFVALSRFDRMNGTLVPHPNPHWSQDSWACIPRRDEDTHHDQRLEIPLGVPRCDNRIAYVFATQGYNVYNPFPHIRSIHVHETGRRYYDKTRDRTIIGGVAMVHPGEALTDPARLDIEIWPVTSAQIAKVTVNRSFERWDEEDGRANAPRPALLAHNDQWQYPAITEQHAFHRMRALLPEEEGAHDALYLGFPFATLVDLHAQLGPEHPRTQALQGALDALVAQISGYKRVVTVAQHIRVRQFAHLFVNAGITDLFWSHCQTGEDRFDGAPGMQVHPFPLYPVQQVPRGPEDFDRRRRWLYSFVGAKAHTSYLTEVRRHIIEQLASDPRGKVIERGSWHYQKIVYDAQILQRGGADALAGENDTEAAAFREIMDESTFTLCPSGTGPNSIRLWEAMLNGSIPVILSDRWAAPGNPELWETATIRCPETLDAVAALPDRLAEIEDEPACLRAMREALMVLTKQYGPESFIPDNLLSLLNAEK